MQEQLQEEPNFTPKQQISDASKGEQLLKTSEEANHNRKIPHRN